MNTYIRYALFLGLGAMSLAGCQDREAELLTPKLYFETVTTNIEVDGQETITVELKSRVSSKLSEDVKVTYSIADAGYVDAYNKKHGKEYVPFLSATLASETSTISAGNLYSETIDLAIDGLSSIEDGVTYLCPVMVHTGDIPVIEGSELTYFAIKKPVKVTKAAEFKSNYIKVPITPLKVFSEVTYEAVININSFGQNNTVMGCEGVMIMRIGDAGGGTVPEDILQIAGKSEITWTGNPLSTGKWYHLAFTCTSDGVGRLYVNGEKVIESSYQMSSDLTDGGADFGFSIGKVPGFMWGERPFNGLMCEVRLWDVVRTDSQIKENMLSVDPETPGLVAYYKLNGEVKDASGVTGAPETNVSQFRDLDNPVVIGGKL